MAGAHEKWALRTLCWTCSSLLAIAQAHAVEPGDGEAAPRQAPSALTGYSAESSKAQRDWEGKFRAGIVPDNIRENMRRLSARPHHVGSPYDKDNAEWISSRFKEWGFDAQHRDLQRAVSDPEGARCRDAGADPVSGQDAGARRWPSDPTSGQTAEQLPTYNAYSADGDVTAPLVYVNFGNREDYEQLDRLGISVKGAIVIARYGGGWRGIKPKVAGEHGAIGCIIYSDPKGDGYYNGDDYPAGGWRPREGVQRGSVMDTDYPGDPLTPGVAATADAKRSGSKEAKTITRIPVLPISYADALPLLSALKGPDRPREPGAARCPSRITSAPGPRRCISRLRRTGTSSRSTTSSAPCAGRTPTSGCCAAITTTRGSTAPTIPSPAWPPCWRKRACWANFIARGGRRSAPSSIARGTGRSPGCWARSNGWRPTWRSCRSTPSLTSIPTATSAGSSSPAGRRTCRPSSAGWRAMSRIRRPICPSFSAPIWRASPGRKTPRSAATFASAAISW